MTAASLARLLSKSSKGITYETLEYLRGAIARENRKGNMVTFEQVIAQLTAEQQQLVGKALLVGKGR